MKWSACYPVVFLGLITLCFFAPVLFGGSSFFISDLSLLEWPNHVWSKAHFLSLWNPLQFTGQPHLGNIQNYALEPLHLVSLAWPSLTGFNFFIASHYFIASIGTYFFLRSLDLSKYEATFGTLIFVFGGFYFSLSKLPLLLNTMTYAPWTGLFTLRALSAQDPQQRFRQSIFAGLFLALQWVGGEPQMLFFSLGAIFAIGKWRQASTRVFLRTGLTIIGLGLIFAAVQILPFFEFLAHSNRAEKLSLDLVTQWSLQPETLLSLFFPHEFVGIDEAWGLGYWEPSGTYMASLHVGVAGLGLFLCSLQNKKSWMWVGCFLIGLFFAFGKFNPVFSTLLKWIPALGFFRYPEKFFFFCHVALTAGAIIGFRMIQNVQRKTRIAGLTLTLILLLLVWFFDPIGFLTGQLTPTESNAFWILYFPKKGLAFFLFLAALFLCLYFPQEKWRRISLILLLATELYVAHHNLNPGIAPNFYQKPKVLSLLPAMGPGERLFATDHPTRWVGRTEKLRAIYQRERDYLSLTTAQAYGIANLQSVNSLHLADFDIFLNLMEKAPLRTLQFFGAHYFLSPMAEKALKLFMTLEEATPALNVYEVPQVLPFFQTFDLPSLKKGTLENVERLLIDPRQDFASWAVVDFDPSPLVGEIKSGSPSLHVETLKPDRIRVVAESTSPIWFQIRQSFYPGWKAWVNGKPVTVSRSNHFFQGIALDAGVSNIVLAYQPFSVRLGAFISLGGLALAIFIGFRVKRPT